jgi:hypothetical protein
MTKVAVAYVHPNEVAASFHESLFALVMHDAGTDRALAHEDGKLAFRCNTNGLVAARNAAARAFLDGGAEWLLWLDTDMGFAPDVLSRLLAAANPIERPIMGALCFSSREVGTDGMGGYRTLPRPTIYDWTQINGAMRFASRITYPVNQLIRCSATGSAAVLIHRSVFERISASSDEHGLPADSWYDRLPGSDGSLLGEDISFCARAGAVDIPVHVHTGVRTTHLKPMWLGEAQFWAQTPAPPATERTAVIVPVMGRPEQAAPFMASLRASTGLASVYAVCDKADEDAREAWADAGAALYMISDVRGRPGTFAEKVNAAALSTDEPWLFPVGSDVHFWPGWLDHAQHTARLFDAKVVGTNDLGNPATLAGEHSPHLLIARQYVDEFGASWDGPGVVCHEGYRHQYVDNEIVEVAGQRGVWQMALGSRVEHLHPLWGKAPVDDVYLLGEKHATADYARFRQRVATHGGAR